MVMRLFSMCLDRHDGLELAPARRRVFSILNEANAIVKLAPVTMMRILLRSIQSRLDRSAHDY